MKRWWIVAGAAATVATAPLVAQGGGRETAVFAGGCFWGVDAVFRHVRGVLQVVSGYAGRSEEHTSELQSRSDLVCRLLLEKKKKNNSLISTFREYTAQEPVRGHSTTLTLHQQGMPISNNARQGR